MRHDRLISMAGVLSDPVPPVDWLIEGWIGKGTRTVLYGEFGSMKSWLLIHMALCMASGKPWAEHTTRPVPVLYIDEEMAERTLRARAKRLAHGLQIRQGVPLKFLSHGGVRFDAGGAERLMSMLNRVQYRPQVIVVETLRRVLVGKENESSDVAAFWRNVDPLVAQGVTFIISHHMRKPNPDHPGSPRHMASGSTDILAGGDVGIALTRPEQNTLILTCVKNRDTEEARPLTIKVQFEAHDGPVRISRAADFVDNWADQMLTLCRQYPDKTHKQIFDLHAEQIGVSYITYWRRLQTLACVHQPATSAPATFSAT